MILQKDSTGYPKVRITKCTIYHFALLRFLKERLRLTAETRHKVLHNVENLLLLSFILYSLL